MFCRSHLLPHVRLVVRLPAVTPPAPAQAAAVAAAEAAPSTGAKDTGARLRSTHAGSSSRSQELSWFLVPCVEGPCVPVAGGCVQPHRVAGCIAQRQALPNSQTDTVQAVSLVNVTLPVALFNAFILDSPTPATPEWLQDPAACLFFVSTLVWPTHIRAAAIASQSHLLHLLHACAERCGWMPRDPSAMVLMLLLLLLLQQTAWLASCCCRRLRRCANSCEGGCSATAAGAATCLPVNLGCDLLGARGQVCKHWAAAGQAWL
jgi:hypothetical protein